MNKKISLIIITLLSLAGCNSKDTPTNENKVIFKTSKQGKIYKPSEIEISETFHSIEAKRFYNTQVLPSVGNVNILVVPILFDDYATIDLNNDGVSDNEKVHGDLKKAFFGKSEETGFESVSSYYQKSSFGKLNIQGTVTDFYNVSNCGYSSAYDVDISETYDVCKNVVSWLKNVKGMDLTKYDNDKDGYIDGLWLIYSAPNYQNGGPRTEGGNYWAYTSWGNQRATGGNEAPNVLSPVYNLFGWASYDFMYESYGLNKVDAHTYIHETGHFLGLNDYYSENLSYCPLGRNDMMDSNIGDHNSYSKMLLGWTKPYIVLGSGEVSLKDLSKENNLIVVLDDEASLKDNKFDPFNEYILIEYYSTKDELIDKDSKITLKDGSIASNSEGYRVYHVDNRKFICDVSNTFNVTMKEYENEELDASHKLLLPLSNGRGYNTYNAVFNLDGTYNLFDEIRQIEKHNIDTFSNGGYQKEETIFTNNDKFSLELYGKNFFYNNDKLNNGKTLSCEITFKMEDR